MNHAQRTSATRPRRPVGRIIVIAILVLPLLGCCYLLDLWQAIPPLRYAWMHHIPQVQGRLELIAPGQWHPGGSLSPDGRTLWLHGTWDGPREYLLWDLVTDTRQSVALTEPRSFRWLDNDWLAVYGFFPGGYALIDAQIGEVTPITTYDPEQYSQPDGHLVIEPLLRSMTQLYVVEAWGRAGYVIIARGEPEPLRFELGYGRPFGLEREQLEAWLKTLPHTDRTQYGIGGPVFPKQRFFSHNGRFYATRESRGRAARLAIYRTEDEQLLAYAYKPRWGPGILGWDYTDQGVYFAQRIGGSAGPLGNPETPIFKLTPLTPEEARLQAVQRGVMWLGLALLVGAGGWWLVRWRRRRWDAG
jgi:hypothetical protein